MVLPIPTFTFILLLALVGSSVYDEIHKIREDEKIKNNHKNVSKDSVGWKFSRV